MGCSQATERLSFYYINGKIEKANHQWEGRTNTMGNGLRKTPSLWLSPDAQNKFKEAFPKNGLYFASASQKHSSGIDFLGKSFQFLLFIFSYFSSI